jgi:hypothetical protein
VTLLFASSVALTTEDLIDGSRTLPVLNYVDSYEFFDMLRTNGVPVMLKNTPAHKNWAAMKLWPPSGENPSSFYLAKASDSTVGVKQHTAPKFSIGCCPLKPMTQKEFWIAMSVLPEGQFMYFNAEVSLLDKALRNDLHPQFFGVAQAHDMVIGHKQVITNVWMGSKGSTAALHHDPFDNFFVQIHGSKRFTLFSPELQHALYVYPKTNPSSRQAQVNINEPDLTRFPRLAEAIEKGIEVIVSPGDVLYLPPFWFHQVESLDTAISVNTWFASPDVELMDAAWTESLPFASDWSDEGFILGIKVFLRDLVQAVIGNPRDSAEEISANVRKFFQELVDSRFKPLYGDSAPIHSDLLLGIKTTDDPHLRVHMREQSELDANTFITADSLPHLASICTIPTSHLIDSDPSWKIQLDNSVKSLSRHFLTVDKHSAIQTIHLEDFVEDMIGQAVGDKSVYHYISSCLLTEESEEDAPILM